MSEFTVLFSHASEDTIGPGLVYGVYANRLAAVADGFKVKRAQGVRFKVLKMTPEGRYRDREGRTAQQALDDGVERGWRGGWY